MGENLIANDCPAWVGPQWTMVRTRVCSSCSRFTVFILLFSICGMLTGCGTSNESTVSGKVTLDGQPLSTGTVTFHPVAGGPAAYGQIQADSSYRLKTGSAAGLALGSYVVTVVATESPKLSEEAGEEIPPLLTPERYGEVKQTDLEFTIRPGDNKIDLALTN